MNMKCAICGSDKFHLDIENQTVSCSACSFYCDFKALVRGNAAPKAQSAPQRPAYNPADFEIVGGVLKKYKGAAVDVVVPDGVIEISRDAFSGLTYITSIKLPEGLRVIRREAFWGCRNLRKINIPNSVEVIEQSDVDVGRGSNIDYVKKNRCFIGCKSLTDISYAADRININVFEGTPYFEKNDPVTKYLTMAEANRKKAHETGCCPKCNVKLNFFKKCPNCGRNWK